VVALLLSNVEEVTRGFSVDYCSMVQSLSSRRAASRRQLHVVCTLPGRWWSIHTWSSRPVMNSFKRWQRLDSCWLQMGRL
ncbi:hypothetical protein Dimus_015378, partial [Dionaea muscipula]